MKYTQNYPSDQSQSLSVQQSQHQEAQLQNEMNSIKNQLKNVPYELLLSQLSMKNESKLNNKEQKSKQRIKKTKFIEKQKQYKDQAIQFNIHRKNKKKIPILFKSEKKKGIDPRFETYAGNYNPDLAMKSYEFIPKMQNQQIVELKSKLKSKSKKNKLNSHQREVLTKEYNKLTSDYKRVELQKIQQSTKKQFKTENNGHFAKKNQFKQAFVKNKLLLTTKNEGQRKKQIKEKTSQIQKRKYIQGKISKNIN